eukprot:scaffold1_cov402-Prasinococcus_capsulatus_cf.AAC.17
MYSWNHLGEVLDDAGDTLVPPGAAAELVAQALAAAAQVSSTLVVDCWDRQNSDPRRAQATAVAHSPSSWANFCTHGCSNDLFSSAMAYVYSKTA